MPVLAITLLLGLTPTPATQVVQGAVTTELAAPAELAGLTGTGLWSRVLCAGCVAAIVAVATELTPLGVLLVANSAPWAASGCAFQCAIATM